MSSSTRQRASTPVAFRDPPGLPPELALALSDAVHNLRSALDYMVYELARHDAGQIVDETQFIIADDKARFDDGIRRRLSCLTVGHMQALEALQPYQGTEWTRTLRDISNPDKHRHLTPVTAQKLGSLVTVYPADGQDVAGRRLPSGQTIQVTLTRVIRVSLPGGAIPIVETLRELQLQVGTTIESFKGEF
jgi:hypothetical protein